MTSPIFRTPALPLALLLGLLPVAVPAWTGPYPLTAQERERPLPNAADVEIYGLAVDSTAFPGESTVLLLQGSTLWVAPRVLEQRFDVPQRSLTADADTSRIPLWVGAAVGAGAGLVYGISVCQSIGAVGTLVVAIVR